MMQLPAYEEIEETSCTKASCGRADICHISGDKQPGQGTRLVGEAPLVHARAPGRQEAGVHHAIWEGCQAVRCLHPRVGWLRPTHGRWREGNMGGELSALHPPGACACLSRSS
eukprot:364594-Chlamydomonas_euryale.AAC.3